jgi:hypothetical protein
MKKSSINRKYRNRQIRYVIVGIISLLLTIGSFIHDYYEEEEEHPRTEGFIDVNDFIGAHILTKKTIDCNDTLYNEEEEITIDWDISSEQMMFKYTNRHQECGSNWNRYRFHTGNCFLAKDMGETVKSTIHELELMRKDSLPEKGILRYEYGLQVVGNIESFTWKTSKKWTKFELLNKKIRSSCPNILAIDLY